MKGSFVQVPTFTAGKSYQEYREEVDVWLAATEVNEEEQGLFLAVALPHDAPHGIREQVLGPFVGLETLSKKDGAKKYLSFLESVFLEDSLVRTYNKYKEVESFKRGKTQSMKAYIAEFEIKLAEARKLKIEYPPILEAFKLLEGSNITDLDNQSILTGEGSSITDSDIQSILTGIEHERTQVQELPKQVKKCLRKFANVDVNQEFTERQDVKLEVFKESDNEDAVLTEQSYAEEDVDSFMEDNIVPEDYVDINGLTEEQLRINSAIEESKRDYEQFLSREDIENQPQKKKNSSPTKRKYTRKKKVSKNIENEKTEKQVEPMTPKVFACTICKYENTDSLLFQCHMEHEHNQVVYKCLRCEFKTVEQTELHKHLFVTHKIQMLECKQCDYRSVHKKDLVIHVESKHQGSLFCCEFCAFTTALKNSWRNHVETKHKKDVQKCEHCEFKSANKRQMKRHITAKHLSKKNKCKLCDFESVLKSELKIHVEAEHLGIKYNCELCSFTTKFKRYIKRHTDIKHNNIKHKCELCDYETSFAYDLKRHKVTYHDKGIDGVAAERPKPPTKPKPPKPKKKGDTYQCDQCEYQTGVSFNLKKHIETKHEGKGFWCEYCGYKANEKVNLKKHIDGKHIGVKYMCHFCPVTSSFYANICRHLADKHKERDYTCYACEFSCVKRPDHTKHILDNHGKDIRVLYCCTKCDFRDVDKSRFDSHSDGHTDALTTCWLCGYVANEEEIILHVDLVHYRQRRRMKVPFI